MGVVTWKTWLSEREIGDFSVFFVKVVSGDAPAWSGLRWDLSCVDGVKPELCTHALAISVRRSYREPSSPERRTRRW